MPTPFTHLEIAQRLLCDSRVPEAIRALLDGERGAFLLGNVAADARNGMNVSRESTHFYAYDRPITVHPWRVMVQRYPMLAETRSRAQAAFLAGYVAHLAIDEAWGLELVRPRFVQHEWHTSWDQRLLMLHIIISFMDERDLALLESWQPSALTSASPDGWLPFMSDESLAMWRDYIAGQIAPGGVSLTLQVLGSRIGKQPEELRAILDSPEQMEGNLWANVPRAFLAMAERKMYDFACEQMCVFVEECVGE